MELNWRHGSFTQLDILALDTTTSPQTLVAVEVKTRVSDRFGRGITAVTEKKLRHIKRSFAYFVKTHPTLPKRLRVDVVDILITSGVENVRYYRNVL
ncbi:MAG: YraN family protein [bacterium]